MKAEYKTVFRELERDFFRVKFMEIVQRPMRRFGQKIEKAGDNLKGVGGGAILKAQSRDCINSRRDCLIFNSQL